MESFLRFVFDCLFDYFNRINLEAVRERTCPLIDNKADESHFVPALQFHNDVSYWFVLSQRPPAKPEA
jgi:hypothetical protein